MTYKGRPITAEAILMLVTLWALLVKQRHISLELRAKAGAMGIEL